MKKPDITLFVGPTAYGVRRELLQHEDVLLKPPVRRGDIEKLLAEDQSTRTIVIADGTFHSFPAVGHAEIRQAVEAGWIVWGLCSMGALRAAEMRSIGVRGFGEVYRRYLDNPDLDDDEVALLHASEAPHRPMSEPLIHIRAFVDHLVARNHITQDSGIEVIDSLKHRWYVERTIPLLRSLLGSMAACDEQILTAEIEKFDTYRLKQNDLVRFMEEEPWKERAR
ncbi:TfuA-like protein [Streptomyces sp. NPDC012600]|uniref:TfuA-like protein n=1 Tax=Streptomyces sp. NPDC012600 TaxID=3415005 RepID=UPI003C30D203